MTLDGKAYLLVYLVFVEELHQVVIAEVSLLVLVKIDEESLDHFVDRDLRYLL